MYQLRLIVLLTLGYLTMTSNLEPANVVVGLLLAVGVMRLVRPRPMALHSQNVVGSLWALVRYLTQLAGDLVVSGLQVARMVLSPVIPIRPGIIAIPAQTRSELGVALSAHAITLTPGELVVEMDEEQVMYTHCLDATHSAEYIQDAVDMRRDLLDQIF